jgi:hypothetical protein
VDSEGIEEMELCIPQLSGRLSPYHVVYVRLSMMDVYDKATLVHYLYCRLLLLAYCIIPLHCTYLDPLVHA